MELDQSLAVAKALGDRSRLLILNALRSGPLCVEDLAARLDLASSTVSFHLAKLAGAGLVSVTRDQYYSIYSLAAHISEMRLDTLIAFRNPEEKHQAQRATAEQRRVLRTFFREGRLHRMPAQKKKRDMVLGRFAALFERERLYPEREVDETIHALFADHCLVRRLLVEGGYLTRERGTYMRTTKPVPEPEEPPAAHEQNVKLRDATEEAASMPAAARPQGHERSRRKALKHDFKTAPKAAGVFRIRNRINGRVFLGSALNLHGPLNRIEFELRLGSFRNRELQEDFARHGREAFDFEVLEVIEPGTDPDFDVERELWAMERLYAQELDRTNTYNTGDDIRFLRRRKRMS
jgi:biotin operon repressor